MLYLIKFNENDYDEYDSFVVRAKDEAEAVSVIERAYPKSQSYCGVPWRHGYTVESIPEKGDAEIILGSYNAG